MSATEVMETFGKSRLDSSARAQHSDDPTRNSADAQGLRDAPQIQNIALQNACNRATIQGHSRSVSGLLLQHLYLALDITTLTAWDLEKSFTFDNKIYITSRVHFPIYVKTHCS